MKALCLCSDPEKQPCSAVDIPERKPEFGAGIFRIDRLVRIKDGLSRSKFPQVAHALSGGLAFQFF
jgi:hypothetical protein